MVAKKSKAGSRNRSRLPKPPRRLRHQAPEPQPALTALGDVISAESPSPWPPPPAPWPSVVPAGEVDYQWAPAGPPAGPGLIFIKVTVPGLAPTRFELDWDRLDASQRATAWSLLDRHSKGLDDQFERRRAVSLLYDLSLQQTHPAMTPAERQVMVGETLTIPKRPLLETPVGVQFDWDTPTKIGGIVFRARLERAGQISTNTFEIDLLKLKHAELEQLHLFLGRRHAGLTTHYEMSWHLAWLLEISIQQTEPQLSPAERQRKVRQLLLVGVRPETPEALARGPGVSPLLIAVGQRARQRLRREHQIDIENLEYGSVRLHHGLEQFRDKTSPDFQTRAEAYTALLIEHHQRVQSVGELVGGQIGEALAADAKRAISRLLAKQAEHSQ